VSQHSGYNSRGTPFSPSLRLYVLSRNEALHIPRNRPRSLPSKILMVTVMYMQLVQPVKCGPGSSVSIATDYGLDGPGSNPGGDEIFCPSRPALGPTLPPVK